MRIAIDARELQGQPTGVGRYLAGILGSWATLAAAQAHEIILCAPFPLDPAVVGSGSMAVRAGWRGGGHGTLWEQLTLPRLVREVRADVLFAPAYTGPLHPPAPMVVAVFDVSFSAHPEWFGWREGLRRRALTRRAARCAARVLTSSEFSKGEIARRLGVDPRRIAVVYPGADAVLPSLVLRRENLVLYVGSLFARRHVPELIEAFARLARERGDVRLEVVGDNRTRPRVDFHGLAAASGAAERIAVRSYVPEGELASLYARARAFVFLSDYEGFGLTPLEALAAGVPIVVLDTPVAREVYEDAALYVPQPSPALVQAAIARALFDDTERRRILDASARVLRRYSWRRCGSQVLDVLVAAAR